MSQRFLVLGLFALTTFGITSPAATICPTTLNTNSDCAFLVDIGINNVISVTNVLVGGKAANPYDGADDTLVGVTNSSGVSYTGSFVLNGPDIFGFDGDGICVYASQDATGLTSYCNASQKGGLDPVDYQGPLNTFTVTSGNSGFINITGLAAGGTTFFSLEGAPGSITITSSPEPATWWMVAGGAAVLFIRRTRVAVL